MFDPHAMLEYLFDEIGLQISQADIGRYWQEAADRGCPWAATESGQMRIPVKIFGDDCVYDERQTKAYAIYMSLPLWRPKSARNSRFLIWTQKSSQFVGIEGLQPVLARMVWSFNLLYHTGLEKSGHRFCVCEIGGDWSWNRFFWQIERHWNSAVPCMYCDVKKYGRRSYVEMPVLPWKTTVEFLTQLVGSGLSRQINPLVLLCNFDISLVAPCQLHNLNLGLLWTLNGASLATFAEMGLFGDAASSLAKVLECAWDDFRVYLKQAKLSCSQSKFTVKMVFKPGHGAYWSAKGYNSRVLSDWLADCALRLWERRLNDPNDTRLFGKWLSGQPHLLHRVLVDEQVAPVCYALTLGTFV